MHGFLYLIRLWISIALLPVMFSPFHALFTIKLTFSRHFWHMTYYSSQLEHTLFTRNTRQPVSNPLLLQHRPGRLPLSPPYYIEEVPHTLEQPTPPLQYDRRQGQHSGKPRQPVPPPQPGSPGLRLPVLELSSPSQEPTLPDRSPPSPELPARPSPPPLSEPSDIEDPVSGSGRHSLPERHKRDRHPTSRCP